MHVTVFSDYTLRVLMYLALDRTRLATVTATRLILSPLDLPAGVAEWTVEFERVRDSMPVSRHP